MYESGFGKNSCDTAKNNNNNKLVKRNEKNYKNFDLSGFCYVTHSSDT